MKLSFNYILNSVKLTIIIILCIGLATCSEPKQKISPSYLSDQSSSGPELFAPGIISTGDDEAHATLTKDGKTLYFIKNSPGFTHWTIVVSHFSNRKWSIPEVASFSGRYSDADVSFSPDGNTLYFISKRPVAKGGQPNNDTDIWMMQKTETGWGKPQHLSIISSPGNEWFPMVTQDGTLYFGSERRNGNFGPAGTSDLWRSEWVNGHFTEPENLGKAINTTGQDIEAYIAPNERFMIFSSSGRSDTYGAYDLYISYNRNGKWSEPKNLGSQINSEGWEFGAKLTPDGNYLFFTSNRSTFNKPLKQRLNYKQLLQKIRSPQNGLNDIYRVDADVFLEKNDKE